MNARRDKWDRIYATRNAPGAPPRVLEENRHLLPRSGKALDLASGLGAGAFALAQAGLRVDALDLSGVAVDQVNAAARNQGLAVTATAGDATELIHTDGRYDVILVCRFLDRALIPSIIDALAPGGLIYYQTFTQPPPGVHRSRGPGNPDFLLAPNELLRLFAGLAVLHFRDEQIEDEHTQGLAIESYLVARKNT